MKINRLVQIIVILLNKEKTTAKELADRLGVSVRTIYRDIDILSVAGIPIYTNKGQGGGIYLLEDYTLNKAMLSEGDKEELMLALQTISAIEEKGADSLIEKLGGLFGEYRSSYLEVDFTGWGNEAVLDQRFKQIKEAILASNIIAFKYVNAKGEQSSRRLRPYKILYRGQGWYVKGICLDKKSERIFKLSRMRSVEVLEGTLEEISVSVDNGNTEVYKKPSNIVAVKLRFRPEILYRVLDMYTEEQIQTDDKGYYIVEATYPYDEWVIGHILSFGGAVKVLEPRWLQEVISKKAKIILGHYN